MRDEFITLVHTWRDDRCNFPKYNPSICPGQKCDIEAVSIIKGKDLFHGKLGFGRLSDQNGAMIFEFHVCNY